MFASSLLLLLAAPSQPLAGWPGVFPELTGYARQFQAPAIGKDRSKDFRQVVTYEWTGGDIRKLTVTASRGSEFRPGKPADQLKDFPKPAWFQDGVLLISLGDDRGLRVKGEGSLGKERVLALAGKFPLDRLSKALEQPPRDRARRDLEDFRAITRDMTYADLTAWVGDAERDRGSGIHIMVFPLADGSQVLVGTPDFVRLLYIKHQSREGKTTDLLR